MRPWSAVVTVRGVLPVVRGGRGAAAVAVLVGSGPEETPGMLVLTITPDPAGVGSVPAGGGVAVAAAAGDVATAVAVGAAVGAGTQPARSPNAAASSASLVT